MVPSLRIPRRLARRTLLSLLIGLQLLPRAVLTAHAQILTLPTAPGALRPTVLATPHGVPLVNIQTPSAAGVSRNLYSQFDVGANGAVLNNSRTGGTTQIAGAVPGNPWLQNGTARVILNEVYSNDPSRLNGPVEVAGDRAQVVIANPSGIQVDGGRFINAAGVTLTTGIPQFDALGTGGVLGSLGMDPTGRPTQGAGAQAFGTQLGQNLQAGAARAVIETAIKGGSLESNLASSLRSALVDTAAAQTAFAIGEQNLDGLSREVAHAMAGCAAGAAREHGSCGATALGAVLGDLAADHLGFDANGVPRSDAIPMAAMFGSIGAAVAGYDAVQINQAGTAAATAAANNSLMHYPQKALQKLGEVLKSLELEPLVQSQQAIREYLEGAATRGGLTEGEIAGLAVLYAANEALFPTTVLDILPGGGKAIGKAGTLVKTGIRAEEAAKLAVVEAHAVAATGKDALQTFLHTKSMRGNFNVGSMARSQMDEVGTAWVGPSAKAMMKGDVQIGWTSLDGLKTYRFPQLKENGFAAGRTQGNLTEFLRLDNGQTQVLRNAHIDLLP